MSATMSEDIRQLINTIDFGMEVEAFLQSPIGRYLVQRAEGEVEDAVEELKAADPEDAKALRAIQNRVKVAESVQYWLAEAITAGQNAQREYIESSNQQE